VVNDENGMSSEMRLERLSEYDKDEYTFEEILDITREITYPAEGESLRELSREDALATAEETVSALGAQGMVLAHAEAKQYPADTLESYYTFIFTHEVNGVPCIYDTTGIANDEGYNDIWDYEQLLVQVDAHGIKCAYWTAPCDISQQLSDSTPMISFEEVMNCFSKMVFIKNSYLETELEEVVILADGAVIHGSAADTEVTIDDNTVINIGEGDTDTYTAGSILIHIDRVTLGLMRVQSGDEFLLIPVWDFYGYKEVLTPEGEDLNKLVYENSNESLMGPYAVSEECLLTINAIDGSVIDLELGY
jgi:hypothetical protein